MGFLFDVNSISLHACVVIRRENKCSFKLVQDVLNKWNENIPVTLCISKFSNKSFRKFSAMHTFEHQNLNMSLGNTFGNIMPKSWHFIQMCPIIFVPSTASSVLLLFYGYCYLCFYAAQNCGLHNGYYWGKWFWDYKIIGTWCMKLNG